MTTTPAMPELPDTDYYLGFCDEGGDHLLGLRGYTADQMDARYLRGYNDALATLQAQPAEVKRLQAEIGRLQSLRQQAVPMTAADAVQVYGIKNGQQTLLGTAPMPSRMKARELAREQFGHFEDGDGSDAELCFYALEQLIEHMERSAHHGITAQGGEG